MTITIRLATPADAPDMAEIHARSWEAAYKGFIPSDYIQQQSAKRPALWQKIVTDANDKHYVIQKDSKTVGIMTVGAPQEDDDLDDRFYELHGIYLHPDCYRQGIGTQAMAFAYDLARKMCKTSMTLWVFADNANSISFYKRCGFAADGKTKILECGKPLTAISMRRDL